MSKFQIVANLLSSKSCEYQSVLSVLDIGARSCELRPYLENSSYVSVDLLPTDKIDIVANLERGLPFQDNTFDASIALDVLEHLDNISLGLAEMDRVTKKLMVICLPNMAHVKFRLRFLATGRIGEKYDLDWNCGPDRHRWLTVPSQTDEYLIRWCNAKGYAISMRRLNSGQSNASIRLQYVEKLMAVLQFPESWHARSTLYLVDKTNS